MDKEQVLQRLKVLRAEETEEVASCAVDEAMAYIQNFCQVSVIPEALLEVCVEMAAALCDRAGQGGVKRLTEGDATVEFETASGTWATPFLEQLRLFRRGKW